MKERCEREDDLIRSGAGPLPAELERHVASCGHCASVLRAARWLRQGAASLDPGDEPAVTASSLYGKAELRRQYEVRQSRAAAVLQALGLGRAWAAALLATGLALAVRFLAGLAHEVLADGALSRTDLALRLAAGALTLGLLSGWAVLRRLRSL
jgi:hypothetical protein